MWEPLAFVPAEGCRQLIEVTIREVTCLASIEAFSRRFFLVIQFDSRMKARGNSLEAISERLWEEEQNGRRYLGICRLEVLNVEYPDNFQLEVLHNCINKRTSRTQKLSPHIFETVSRVYGATDDELNSLIDGGDTPDEIPLSDQSI